jgi:ubiquinone biosynthesis O-methyltransferase
MAIFDGIAGEYDSWYTTEMGKFVDEVETRLALGMFSPSRGMKILDVGCGTGNFSIKLSNLGCRVTGIDISGEMLKQAEQKAKQDGLDVEFQQMDVYKLEFPDEHFDGVFSMAAFEFITEPLRAYKEMYRVLKPGGRMLIGTINPESSWGELYLSKEFQRNSIFKYAKFITMEELKSLDRNNLKQAGECLFIPPSAPDESITMEEEERLSKINRGGFICVLWEKPLCRV